MYKCKIFGHVGTMGSVTVEVLENCVNKWLSEHPNIEVVSFQHTVVSTMMSTISILYKEE